MCPPHICDCLAFWSRRHNQLRGPGGHWLLVFGCCSGVLLDPGLARCWERGGSVRYDLLVVIFAVSLFLVLVVVSRDGFLLSSLIMHLCPARVLTMSDGLL